MNCDFFISCRGYFLIFIFEKEFFSHFFQGFQHFERTLLVGEDLHRSFVVFYFLEKIFFFNEGGVFLSIFRGEGGLTFRGGFFGWERFASNLRYFSLWEFLHFQFC